MPDFAPLPLPTITATGVARPSAHGQLITSTEIARASAYPKLCPTASQTQNAINAIMSGSGPTVFGLFRIEEDAYRAKERIKASGYTKQAYVTYMYIPNTPRKKNGGSYERVKHGN